MEGGNGDPRYFEIGPLPPPPPPASKKGTKKASAAKAPNRQTNLGDAIDDGRERPSRSVSSRSLSGSQTRSHNGHADRDASFREEDQKGDDFNVAVLEREEDYRYGWGAFRPACLQRCRRPMVVLVVLCFCTIAHSFGINGAFPSASRHLQLRFFLTPTDLGFIRMTHGIGSFVMLFPVIYYGSKGSNRPIWIAGGLTAMGFASLLIAMPQIFAEMFVGPYNTRWWPDPLCHHNATQAARDMGKGCGKLKFGYYEYIFMAGYFLYGMGGAPVYAMGLTYLDENVSHELSSIFTGVLSICDLMGAALGFLVAGQFSRFHGDVVTKDRSSTLGPDSPNWYGAWWIGVIVTVALNWLAAIPVLGFPAELPGGARARMDDMRDKMARKGRYAEAEHPDTAVDTAVIRSVLKRCWALLRHPVYIGLMLAQCSHKLMVTIFSTFMPVYLQQAFNLPSGTTTWLTACLVVVAMVSIVIGTFIQNRFYLGVLGNIRLSFAAVTAGFIFIGSFMISCSERPLAGYTQEYPLYRGWKNSTQKLTVDCNVKCQCADYNFDPVCYQQTAKDVGVTIYNKCYAGCDKSEGPGGGASGCACVPGRGNVTADACKLSCSYKLYAFLIGTSWICATLYVRRNAVEQSLLRCVPFSLRVLGLALSEAVVTLIGQIPASPIYGVIMEQTCRFWQERCDTQGSCNWNDVKKLATYTTLCCFGVQFIGACGLGLAVFGSRRLANVAKTSTISPKVPSKEGKSSREGTRSRKSSKGLRSFDSEKGFR